MNRWVDITFDCLPLRSVVRLDKPLDASPAFEAFCERVKAALDKHGQFNSFYLYNGRCQYHLTNCQDVGMIQYRFEGTVLTDAEDLHTVHCDLDVSLWRETCDWLSEPIVDWLRQTVLRSVRVEFDRYIEAGDLEKTRQRIAELQAAADQTGGFIGMYL
jgi:hypothetical protein